MMLSSPAAFFPCRCALSIHRQKARRHSASPPALSQLTASSFAIAAWSAPLLLRLITSESRQESRLEELAHAVPAREVGSELEGSPMMRA